MADSLDLQAEFEEIIGNKNVYFQPPASVLMNYDCIRYSRSGIDVEHANNKIYMKTNRYDGVVITEDPDTTLPDQILDHFQMCSFGQSYVSDNLYHYPFTLYY